MSDMEDLLYDLTHWFQEEVEAGDEALQVWVDRLKALNPTKITVHTGPLHPQAEGPGRIGFVAACPTDEQGPRCVWCKALVSSDTAWIRPAHGVLSHSPIPTFWFCPDCHTQAMEHGIDWVSGQPQPRLSKTAYLRAEILHLTCENRRLRGALCDARDALADEGCAVASCEANDALSPRSKPSAKAKAKMPCAGKNLPGGRVCWCHDCDPGRSYEEDGWPTCEGCWEAPAARSNDGWPFIFCAACSAKANLPCHACGARKGEPCPQVCARADALTGNA